MLLRFISFAGAICLAAGFVQELTLYTELNQGGNDLRFRTYPTTNFSYRMPNPTALKECKNLYFTNKF